MKTLRLLASISLLALVFVACGDEVPLGDRNEDSGIAADGRAWETGDSPYEQPDNMQVDSKPCNGNAQCGEGEFCDNPHCGSADGTGLCLPSPMKCGAACVEPKVCGCDGILYCDECQAHSAGVSVAESGNCRESTKTCTNNTQCRDGEFCDQPLCGTGDEEGTCVPKGMKCSRECSATQVCGCDGKLYCNECQAHSEGVGVSAMGGCQNPGDTICHDNSECVPGEFCNDPSCGTSGKAGVCAPSGMKCSNECRAPLVCGCDGKLYCNDCQANSFGVSVATVSACQASDKPCRNNNECVPGEFCDDPLCGTTDELGTCKPSGMKCSGVCSEPQACGCDGKLYCNDCQAHTSGVSVAAAGGCTE